MISFTVGEYYWFTVFKKIDISEETFFMLIDPKGSKYLLPAESYLNYDFKDGSKIRCRIDKINCTGKMYIEPEHPVYRAGEIYKFKILNETSSVNLFGEEERYLCIVDVFNNEIHVPVISPHKRFIPGDSEDLLVTRVIKGKPDLFLSSEFNYHSDLKKGERYLFHLQGISAIGGKDYYRLIDDKGNFHFLRQKYYADRKYLQGSEIFCTIVNEPIPGTYYLEPDYFDYVIGERYDFQFLKYDKHHHKDGTTEEVLTVLDKYKKECTLFVEWHNFIEPEPSEVITTLINAKVLYIFKGRLFLSIL